MVFNKCSCCLVFLGSTSSMSYRVINGDSDVKTNITVFKTLLCFIEQVGLETQVEDFYDGNR